MKDSLKEHVQQITELPTVPLIAQEILSLVNSKNISVEKLEKIIQNDPAISAKILSVANSAFFRVKDPTRTLNNAIIRVGFDNVKNVAIGVSLMSVFYEKRYGAAIDYQKIFNHSVTVGFIAKLISNNLRLSISDEVVVNGMLHDIGFMVLNRFFSEQYKEVLERCKKGESLLNAEVAVMEFNHTDIGAWLSEKWGLPGSISDAIQFHHSPAFAKKNSKHVAVIHIADYITTNEIQGPVNEDPDYPLDHSALETLGMSESDLSDMEAKIRDDSESGGFFI